MRKLLIAAAVLFVIALCVGLSGAASRVSSGSAPVASQQAHVTGAVTEFIQPHITEVQVGTEWYDPNEHMLKLHVFGQPMMKGVKWQGRINYKKIINMPPIDCPDPYFPEVEGDIRCIEYRVAPGQSVDHCIFRFRFDPPQ